MRYEILFQNCQMNIMFGSIFDGLDLHIMHIAKLTFLTLLSFIYERIHLIDFDDSDMLSGV